MADRERPARDLENALVTTWLLHGLAMLAMAALLLPTMPGGPTASDAERVALIAAHPLRFRLGWLPWHLTAASDLWLAVALVRTPWIPRGATWLSLLLTVLAVLPDQGAQLAWITHGVRLAQEGTAFGDLSRYLAFEAWAFPTTGVYAALLYTLAALAWTWGFARAGTWSRLLTWLSVALFAAFFTVVLGPLLPAPFTLPKPAIAVGNAVGFLLLMAWLALVTERVLWRARPLEAHGRWSSWRAPRSLFAGRLFALLAGSRFVRRLCALLPVAHFRSDITEVVYVSYVVEASRLAAWVPPGLTLQTLGDEGRDEGRWALFTFLTYRHGHFGPSLLGPLRRLFPSPVQSNWRTYVQDDRTGRAGIYFVTNAVGTLLHALGARLMSEGMPMHLLGRGEVTRDAAGTLRVTLDPDGGSAPDALVEAAPTADRTLPAAFAACFHDYEAMLRYAVPQDRAMSTLFADGITVRQEIDLGIALSSCEPLAGTVRSQAARAIVGDAVPVIFRVARVPFHFTGEAHDRWPE